MPRNPAYANALAGYNQRRTDRLNALRNKGKQEQERATIATQVQDYNANANIAGLADDSRNTFANATTQSQTGIANAANTMRQDYTGAADRISALYKDKGNDISDTYRQQEAKARGDLTPWRDAGTRALSTLEGKIDAGPGEMTKDAGYQFRLGEGMRSLDSSSAARGGALSGRAIKEAARYNQGFASNEYEKFNNRFYQSLQPLQTMAGEGRLAANQMGGYSMQAAPGIAEGQRYGAEGAERGIMFGAQGAAGASQWGAEGNMNALQYGANARAGTNMAEGNAMTSGYSAALQSTENDRARNIAERDKARTFNEARRLRQAAAEEHRRQAVNRMDLSSISANRGTGYRIANQTPYY